MAENLLIQLDLDPRALQKWCQKWDLSQKWANLISNEFNNDAELLEANFFVREPSRPAVRTQEVASVGPG